MNKDVSEPSYSDLKFKVWNCNYVSPNLKRSEVKVAQSCPTLLPRG